MSERDMPMPVAEWIAVDWGTSNLRAWAMRGTETIAEAGSERGMATLKPEEFENALLDVVGGWLAEDRVTRVVCCGMVGARQGWTDAGYRQVPCPPHAEGALARAQTRDPRLAVHILPGLSQVDPPDVMRGEETQLAGLLADPQNRSATVCLPGTHTKWVRLEDGVVTGFTTFMTGELFALLSRQSVLRHSLAGEGWSDDAFEAAIRHAADSPQMFSSDLFALRAASLVAGLDPVAARSRLSGLLIGLELAGARAYWQGRKVIVVGAGDFSQIYRAGLAMLAGEGVIADVAGLTLAGLSAANAQLGYRLQGDDA